MPYLRPIPDRASEQLAHLQDLRTHTEAVAAVKHYAGGVQDALRSAAEQLFFLGMAVAKDESLSGWGSRFYARLSREVGYSERMLRMAVDWYDACGGSYKQMKRHLVTHDPTKTEIAGLLRANRESVQEQRTYRRYRDRTVAAGQEPDLEPPEPKELQRPEPPRRDCSRNNSTLNGLQQQVRVALRGMNGAPEAEVRRFERSGQRYAIIVRKIERQNAEAA